MILRLCLIVVLFLAQFCHALFDDNSIAVYWGQAGVSEQNDLSYYCESESVDMVILAFIAIFGEDYTDPDSDGFVLNLSDYCSPNDKNKCTKLGDEIKKCQSLGKKVTISLGGEPPSRSSQAYGFKDDIEARSFAHKLWASFGEGDSENVNRPFGDAVIDGFDIDSESRDQTGYLTLIKELSALSKEQGSKDYVFSAAPQCFYPDESTSELIDGFELDYVFIQFYNNDCGLEGDEGFNFDQWAEEFNKLGHSKTKLYIGLPSSNDAASKGFVADVNKIGQVVDEINANTKHKDAFGGLMFWDASKGFDLSDRDGDESYIYSVWNAVGGPESTSTDADNATSSGVTVTSESSSPIPSRIHNGGGKSKSSMGAVLLFLLFNILIV